MLFLGKGLGGALDARDDRLPGRPRHHPRLVINSVPPLVPYRPSISHSRITDPRFGRDAGGRMLQAYALSLKLKPIVARELSQQLPGLLLNLFVRRAPLAVLRMLGDVEPEGLGCFNQDRGVEAPNQR